MGNQKITEEEFEDQILEEIDVAAKQLLKLIKYKPKEANPLLDSAFENYLIDLRKAIETRTLSNDALGKSILFKDAGDALNMGMDSYSCYQVQKAIGTPLEFGKDEFNLVYYQEDKSWREKKIKRNEKSYG